jgi:transcriptional regulator NrdR family protein
MQNFEGLKKAIQASITKVNEIAELIESIEEQVRSGEISPDTIGKIQLNTLRSAHKRYINDVETYKADLIFFESIEDL